MKFSEKYPGLRSLNERGPDDLEGSEQDGIIKGDVGGPCCVCKEHTFYIEIHYEAPVCSDECLKKLDGEYVKATERR